MWPLLESNHFNCFILRYWRFFFTNETLRFFRKTESVLLLDEYIHYVIHNATLGRMEMVMSHHQFPLKFEKIKTQVKVVEQGTASSASGSVQHRGMWEERSKGHDRSHLTSSSRFACAPWLARFLSFVGAPCCVARIIAIAPARLCTCFLHPFSIAVAVSVQLRKVRGPVAWNLLIFFMHA